jgi:mRNA interferase MazF
MVDPARGEIWTADLNPTRGHEQAGLRPVLVVSMDAFNRGPSGLVIVLPITSRHRGIPSHVPVQPPEGGLRMPSVPPPEPARKRSWEVWRNPAGRAGLNPGAREHGPLSGTRLCVDQYAGGGAPRAREPTLPADGGAPAGNMRCGGGCRSS